MPKLLRFKNELIKNNKTLLFHILLVLMFSSFSALFLYFNNVGEVDFLEILPMVLVFSFIGLFIYIVSSLLVKNAIKGVLISFVICILLFNFALIEQGMFFLFKNLWYWHTVTIALVFLAHLIYLIIKVIPEKFLKEVPLVLTLVFGGLILFNGVMAAPAIISKLNSQNNMVQTTDTSPAQGTAAQGLPNMYVLVWDEYAGFAQMEEYYDYDNAVLEEFLTENGFTISYDSLNGSINTATVMTNFVNLEYVVKDTDSMAHREQLRYNGELFSLLTDFGYEIRTFSDTYFYGEQYSVLEAANSGAATVSGEGVVELLVKQTILYPLFSNNTSYTVDTVTDATAYIGALENTPTQPTLTLMHVDFPHQPFLVDENGNEVPYSEVNNWEDPQYYLGQYKYATKLMMQLIEDILQNDPNAMIFTMSDHGARATTSPSYPEKFAFDYMRNPFHAFYYKGEDLSHITGQSGVNTMRLLLNETLGLTLEEVEVHVNEEPQP